VVESPSLDANKKMNVGRQRIDDGNLRDKIISFLESLTTYDSHYVIDTAPHRKYLNDPTITSISDVEKFFRKSAQNAGIEFPKYSLDLFRRIFVNEFNINFKPPTMDECTTCLWYEAHHKTSEDSYILHKFNHTLSQTYYKASINRELIPKKTLVISLDLARVFDCPLLRGGIFYGSQETLLPLGVHFHNDNSVHLAVWSEIMAGRGTDEISSALQKILMPYLEDSEMEELIVFADNCGGQNKSRFNLVFWKMLLCQVKQLRRIHVNYIFKGNKGFTPDTVFSSLRRQVKKDIPLEYPEAFYRSFEKARTPPINVYRMKMEDFRSFETFTFEFTNFRSKSSRNCDSEGNVFKISRVCQFFFDKEDEVHLKFKYTNYPDEPFKQVKFFRTDAFSSKFNDCSFVDLPLAHPNGIPIDYTTAKDLTIFYERYTRSEEAKKHFKHLKTLFSEEAVVRIPQPEVVTEATVHKTDSKIVFYNEYRPSEYEEYRTRYLKKFKIKEERKMKLTGVRPLSEPSLEGRSLLTSSTTDSTLISSVSSSSISTSSQWSSSLSHSVELLSPSPYADASAIRSVQALGAHKLRPNFHCMMCKNPIAVIFAPTEDVVRFACPQCTYVHHISNPNQPAILDVNLLQDMDVFDAKMIDVSETVCCDF
jgi:hypothetical protein